MTFVFYATNQSRRDRKLLRLAALNDRRFSIRAKQTVAIECADEEQYKACMKEAVEAGLHVVGMEAFKQEVIDYAPRVEESEE